MTGDPTRAFFQPDRDLFSGQIIRGNLRDAHGHSHRGIRRRCRHRSRVSGNDSPGGNPGARFRSSVRWRRAVLHILSVPILASAPGSSLEFIYLSEVLGGIFRKYSYDPFPDAPHPRKEYPHSNEDSNGRDGRMTRVAGTKSDAGNTVWNDSLPRWE